MSDPDPLARPASLEDLVTVQEGSIVSQALVHSSAGSVTLFAFAGGQGLSEHTAPFDALVQGVQGEARVTVGAQEHRLRAGQLLRLPANVPHAIHAIHADEPFHMLLVMIRAADEARHRPD